MPAAVRLSRDCAPARLAKRLSSLLLYLGLNASRLLVLQCTLAIPSNADVLVNCFRSVLAMRPTGEVVQAAYLAVGKIAPDYEGAELNVS